MEFHAWLPNRLRAASAIAPQSVVPPMDRALIDDLVAANRTLARLGVLDAFGHVSVRDPRNPHRYLISRSIAPELVVAADILLLDLDSQTVDPKDEGKLLYRERFIHGEIYKARPDVNAVVHSHSPTVVPFTVTRAKLRPLLHNAGFLGLGVPLFEIRKYAGARHRSDDPDAEPRQGLGEKARQGGRRRADARPRRTRSSGRRCPTRCSAPITPRSTRASSSRPSPSAARSIS